MEYEVKINTFDRSFKSEVLSFLRPLLFQPIKVPRWRYRPRIDAVPVPVIPRAGMIRRLGLILMARLVLSVIVTQAKKMEVWAVRFIIIIGEANEENLFRLL